MWPGRAKRAAPIAAKVSAVRRRLRRSSAWTEGLDDSLMSPRWRHHWPKSSSYFVLVFLLSSIGARLQAPPLIDSEFALTSCSSVSIPEIRRDIALRNLRSLSEAEAEEGVEGGLEGNQDYSDLRALSAIDLQAVLREEERWLTRIRLGEAPSDVEEVLTNVRGSAFEPVEELWGLDLGVASAVVALSCLGACPVSSCNGGAFGHSHQAKYPYISFFLYEASLERLLLIAEHARCGLTALDGLGHLYGPVDNLMMFAREVAAAIS